EQIVERDPLCLGLLPVDVGPDLRNVELKTRVKAGQPRRLPSQGHQLLGLPVQRFETESRTVLDRHLEPADRAESLHGRRWEDREERVLDGGELPVQCAGNRVGGKGRIGTLVKIGEPYEYDAGVGAV